MSVQSQGGGLMIYLLEDEEGIRNFVIYALGRSGIEAEGFGAPSELYAAMEEKLPRLLLLDRMLPEEDGISVLRKLRAREDTRKLPVIMLTAKGMEVDKVEGLDSGADDYITKPFNILEVKARIKAIMRRTGVKEAAPAKEQVIESGDLKLDLDSRRLFILGREVNLTAREFELLELFVTNQNKVFSREKLLQLVWGADYPGDVRTVDVHVRRLREKIEANPSEPKYVHTKWGVGYYYRG